MILPDITLREMADCVERLACHSATEIPEAAMDMAERVIMPSTNFHDEKEKAPSEIR